MELLIVELNRRQVTASRFQVKKGALTLVKTDCRPVSEEETFDLLLQNVAAEGTGSEKVVLALDPSGFYCREMKLPINDRHKVREILPLELKGETAADTEELIFDAIPLRDGKVLALWAKRSDLTAAIEVMTNAGLEPQTVTAAPFHWQQLLPETDGEYVAVSDGSALAVFHDRQPVYFRALTRDEPCREIEKTLTAFEIGRKIQVARLYFIGPDAVTAVDSMTTSATGIPAIERLPVAGEQSACFGGDRARALKMAGAWALARAALSGSPVNFRHGPLAYTAGMAKFRKKLRLTAALAAVLVLLLCVETGIRYYLVKKDLDSLDNSIGAIYHEVFPNRKQAVDEVAELRSEIKRMEGGAGTHDLLVTLKTLAEKKGDGISGFYEAEIEGNQVKLKGDAASFQAVNDFKVRAAAVFSPAEVGETKSRPDGSVTFTFRGTLPEEDR